MRRLPFNIHLRLVAGEMHMPDQCSLRRQRNLPCLQQAVLLEQGNETMRVMSGYIHLRFLNIKMSLFSLNSLLVQREVHKVLITELLEPESQAVPVVPLEFCVPKDQWQVRVS